MQDAVERAVNMFNSDKYTWRNIQLNGMRTDLSWDSSAQKYLKLYEMAIAKRAG
jgi:starch synthase